MQRRAHSEDITSESRLRKGGEGSIAGRTNQKDAAAERRDAQGEFHSAAQARAWADGDFDADHGFAFDGVGRPAHGTRYSR